MMVAGPHCEYEYIIFCSPTANEQSLFVCNEWFLQQGVARHQLDAASDIPYSRQLGGEHSIP
jgi:hypothetical protein